MKTNDLQEPSRSLHLRGKLHCAVLCGIWGTTEDGWFPGGASCIGILVVLSMEVFQQLGCAPDKMIILHETEWYVCRPMDDLVLTGMQCRFQISSMSIHSLHGEALSS